MPRTGDKLGDLDPRRAEVLRAIVRRHIATGEPVGSRTVAEGTRLDLSPASIRALMAELEESGLLLQPHPSAGRVPTVVAYRIYVEQLLVRRPRVAAAQAESIDRALTASGGEIPDLLGEASRQLSHLSQHVGLVLAPDLQRIIVEQIEFIRLSDRRVLTILVDRSGVVRQRSLQLDAVPTQDELERIGRYLSDDFRGQTLPHIRAEVQRRLSAERAAYDRLRLQSLELASRAMAPGGDEADLFVDGISNLLESPDLADRDMIRSLFKTLEEKETMVGLLSRLLDGDGVQVVIGDENPLSDLACCSLIASNYGVGDRVMGTVGIVGPTRMRYPRAIALVDYLASAISRLLLDHGN